MSVLKLLILGEPKPKQSFRFSVIGGHVRKYQKAEVKQNEYNIQNAVLRQLPEGFMPIGSAIKITKLHYIFTPVKSLKAVDRKRISNGFSDVPKATKPDLTDNLAKGLMDSLQGIVFLNDSQIVAMDNVRKFYGLQPRIELELEY